MASLRYDEQKKQAVIQFTDKDGRRRTLRRNKISRTAADRFFTHVDKINEARRTNASIPGETLAYLNELGQQYYDRLVKIGLVEPRAAVPEHAEMHATLGEWLDQFEAMKAVDWKPASKVVFGHTRRNLLKHFTSQKPIAEITVLDAENFERFLKSEKLSKATMAKRCSIARTVFEAARKHRLLESNPFKDAAINVVVRGNRSRQVFVDSESTLRVLDKCPDAEWRLLVGLARYGGLRIPSEALSLKWEHVLWDRGELVVPSPKTEHHEGRESRRVPLFPELLELLQDAHEQAPERVEWVITRYRPQIKATKEDWQAMNLRTQFMKIIRRAGLTPWPRLWVNLRSSRATELADKFPAHVVNQWLGHSERVANEHYRQTTRDHFERAVSQRTSPKADCSALHLALHSEAVSNGKQRNGQKQPPRQSPKNSANPKKEAALHSVAKRQSWTILDSNQ